MSTRTSASRGATPRTTRGRAGRLAAVAAGGVLAGAALGASPAMADATASVCD